MLIHSWPDGTWCDDEPNSLNELLAFMSDDFESYYVPDDWTFEQIDEFVTARCVGKSNGNKQEDAMSEGTVEFDEQACGTMFVESLLVKFACATDSDADIKAKVTVARKYAAEIEQQEDEESRLAFEEYSKSLALSVLKTKMDFTETCLKINKERIAIIQASLVTSTDLSPESRELVKVRIGELEKEVASLEKSLNETKAQIQQLDPPGFPAWTPVAETVTDEPAVQLDSVLPQSELKA